MTRNQRNQKLSLDRRHLPRQAGFTLIELLVPMAIIAVLIFDLAPAVQTNRELINLSAGVNDLRLIGQAQTAFFAANGNFAASFDTLQPFLPVGQKNWAADAGFLFSIQLGGDSNSFSVLATPAAVGKTGVQTCTIDQMQSVNCNDIPGATRLRDQMFLRIAALGAVETANDIIAATNSIGDVVTDQNGTPQTLSADDVREFLASPAAVPTAFNALDTDHDGRVTAAELFTPADQTAAVSPNGLGANSGGVAPTNFLAAMKAEMAIGAANEDLSGIGVTLSQLPPRLCKNHPDGNENVPSPCEIFTEPPNQNGDRHDEQ